jgi:phage tail protein X
VPARSRDSGSPDPLDLEALIGDARARLPASHRALLEQIGVQDTVVHGWPAGVLALYETLRSTPPAVDDLVNAVAVWLQELRVVAYNGDLLTYLLGAGNLDSASVQSVVDNIAWHEYGHALSVTRASSDVKNDGPRLLELLPPGIRGAIDYPGAYRRRQVFDEVIANIYAFMIGRAVQSGDYGVPGFLHVDVYDAFTRVVPWPPSNR